MKTRNWFLVGIAFAAILAIVITNLVKPSRVRIEPINPAFGQYISAFSTGLISANSTIQVKLAYEFADSSEIGKPIDKKIFEVSPRIKGKAFWKDSRTVEYKPDEPLERGEDFTAVFHLNEIIQVPDSLAELKFNFRILHQDLAVELKNLHSYEWDDLQWKYLVGTLRTADDIDSDVLEKILRAEHKGHDQSIKWSKVNDREYTFIVDSIERTEKKSNLEISWDGKAIGIKKSGSMDVEVPSINMFKVMKTSLEFSPSQCLAIEFSDPLLPDQDLQGLISLQNYTRLSFSIDKNIVRAFFNSNLEGEQTVTISPGIRNAKNQALPKQAIMKVVFENLKPALKLIGEGVLLPSSEGLIFPFEAVNIKAVNVKIIQIFEKNIPQFLQINDLSENDQLYRVGKLVARKVVALGDNGKTDLGQWNRFGIDLAQLIKVEQGAIYRVSLSFSREQSIFPCAELAGDELQEFDYDEEEEYWGYDNEWYNYDDYRDEGSGYYYGWDYNWSERENPCKNSYYAYKGISRNILATNIGMVAKQATDGSLSVLVTDLLKSSPLSGVEVIALDYQLNTLSKSITDGNGFTEFKPNGKPFLLMAKNGKQTSYMPLRDGKALSMSYFDVEGQTVKQGIKGFIYAERGVWRPGDTLFIDFMLEDKENQLPQNIPLVAELYNARGKLYKKQVNKNSLEGIYSFKFPTLASDQTGTWRVQMKMGNSTFSKSLKVETIKPNRLKIKLEIPGDAIDLANPKPIILQTDWLHGAPGKDLSADMVLSLRPDYSAFSKSHKDYIFQTPFSEFSVDAVKIAEGQTDETGKLSFTPKLDVTDAPGVLRASITTKVYEKGGGFSISYSSAQVHPYASYVGLKVPEGEGWGGSLETGKEHTFSIVDVDKNGKRNSNAKIELTVYKIDWYWWWHQGSYSLANFLSRPGTTTYLKKDYTLPNGAGTFKFKVRNQDNGSYLFILKDKKSGHIAGTTVYMYWPYAPMDSKKEGANLLTLSSDKETYEVGELVNVSIPSSEGGHVYFSIESGSRQIHREVVKSESGTTLLKFKAEKGMAPNIYVAAMLINPHHKTADGVPLRMYGVIPIKIEDPNTHLTPQISMPDEVRPESKVIIKVSESKGKAMAYTLAIVDDGLLDLTSFKTPDPFAHFYAKEALGIQTWDLFDQVIGATGGRFENTLAIGGGDDAKAGEKGSPRANRFKPMVIHLGPFFLKPGATASHTVLIPKYIGSVRVMVVAAKDEAYGNAEKTVKVNSPLMVLGSLPRVAGPGEEIHLPVTVFAMKPEVKKVNVKITTNSMFKTVGNTSEDVSFSKPGESVINFKLLTNDAIGIGKVQITAVSGNLKSTYDVEMDVRTANPMITNSETKVLDPGASWEVDIDPFGIAGTNTSILQVSNLPPMNLEKRLQYLIQYPHGCIEQITSAAFPQLYLSNLMELSPEDKTDVTRNINSVISRLSAYQNDEGGFNYWPGGNYPSEWGSSYAGHFLLEAKQKGYTVNEGMIKSWVNYQKRQARRWSNYEKYFNSDLQQAYRLYTLALAGKSELGLMNRLREQPTLSLQARWRLAAAYALAGRNGVARDLISNASTIVQDYREMSFTYGSSTRDQAMILETMLLLNERESAGKVMKEVAKQLGSDSWYSTQTTAYALMCISKFVGKFSDSGEMKFEYSLNGAKPKTFASRKELVKEMLAAEGKMGKAKLVVKNTGKGLLYIELFNQGQPKAGNESNQFSNLYMDIEFSTLDGKRLDINKLPQGTDFFATITLRHPGILGNYFELALTQIFPSGWEIINRRMEEDSPMEYLWDYQDIRDDRVYTYFSMKPGQSKTIQVMLNAAYQGKFYMAGSLCEAMYDKTISARLKGDWVEVVPSGK